MPRIQSRPQQNGVNCCIVHRGRDVDVLTVLNTETFRSALARARGTPGSPAYVKLVLQSTSLCTHFQSSHTRIVELLKPGDKAGALERHHAVLIQTMSVFTALRSGLLNPAGTLIPVCV